MICTQCGTDRPFSDFYTRSGSSTQGQYRQPCAPCQRARELQRYHRAKSEDSATLSAAQSMRRDGEDIRDTMAREGLDVKYWHSGIAETLPSDERDDFAQQ